MSDAKRYSLHLVIDANWSEIAAFAWRQYREHGRGAIFLDLTRAQVTAEGVRLPELEYLRRGDRRVDGLADQADPVNGRNMYRSLIEHYEPERNLVCIMLEPDGTVKARAQDYPGITPPEAARRAKTREQ